MAEASPKKLYTNLFADISGSTALYEKLGDSLRLIHFSYE